MKKRESFNSRWGFILACIGSAVGMGNIWMFSTRVSLYGGGSFLIPYFLFVALIGFTGVTGEMSFGRATKSGPVDAFGYACETKGKRKAGEALGLIPVLGSLAMAIGYTVVMGWILKYMIGTFTGKTLTAASVDDFAGAFGSMASAFGNNFWQIVALVIAMIILVIMYFVMKKSKLGYEITAIGKNPEFAEATGMNVGKKIIIMMLISGALSGIAGAGWMLSDQFKYTLTFSANPGLGWDGMLIALLGGHSPIGILIAAIFYAALKTGSDSINMYTAVPKEIVAIIQGMIILFLAVKFIGDKTSVFSRFKKAKKEDA